MRNHHRATLRIKKLYKSDIEVILLAIFPILDEILTEIRAIKDTELMDAEVQRHVVQKACRAKGM
jgi:hypothetical protein